MTTDFLENRTIQEKSTTKTNAAEDGIPASSSVRFMTSTRHDDKNDSGSQNKMYLFIGSANLGNAAPDESSLNAWIPADGYYYCGSEPEGRGAGADEMMRKEQEQYRPTYPLRKMVYDNGKENANTKVNITPIENHYCMETIPADATTASDTVDGTSTPKYRQYDILIFGMQEATFDPPNHKATDSSTKTMDISTKNLTSVTTTTTSINTLSSIAEGSNELRNSTNQEIVAIPEKASEINEEDDSDNRKNDQSTETTTRIDADIVSPKRLKSPSVAAVTTAATTTITKAVDTTTKKIQKIHHKTVGKVQTLSTSRDHCQTDLSKASLSSGKGKIFSLSSSSLSNGRIKNNNDSDNNETLDSDVVTQSASPMTSSTTPITTSGTAGVGEFVTSPSATNINQTTTTGGGWYNGTQLLHSMMQQRLPSYKQIISYQRGEMRLIVYIHEEHVNDCTILHVSAQNTGRAGLANKGGIVTELLLYGNTRLSFLTAHLEAHEGLTKYQTRVQTIGDILNGTKCNANSTCNETTTAIHKKNEIPAYFDCSITSHYSFVMGDLNFRTELNNYKDVVGNDEEKHKQIIRTMVQNQEYDNLNDIDELHRALRNKDCLVGYETLMCNFPPTFKVERSLGYSYIDKRRPSYTDRILWKSNHGYKDKIHPLLYEPIEHYTTSDHKPIRAAFVLERNEPYMLRPILTKRRSTNKLAKLIQHTKKKSRISKSNLVSTSLELGQKRERFHLFVSHMKCEIYNKAVRGGSSLALVSTLNELYPSAPNPYICLMSDPIEILQNTIDKRWRLWNNIKKKINPSTSIKKTSSKNSTCFVNSYGYPRSSIQRQMFQVDWENEEIHTELRTHHVDGSSIDLTGAMLRIAVMDRRNRQPPRVVRTAVKAAASAVGTTNSELIGGDAIIGTVTFNLVNLMRSCRHPSTAKKRNTADRGGVEVQMKKFININESEVIHDDEDDDPIVVASIDEPIIKNGIETGRLQCQLEIWWMDSSISSRTFGLKTSTTSNRGRRWNNRKNLHLASSHADFDASSSHLPDRRRMLSK